MSSIKIVVGISVSNEVEETFKEVSVFCRDRNILAKFEKSKFNKLSFRLTFTELSDIARYFFILGKATDIDFTRDVDFSTFNNN